MTHKNKKGVIMVEFDENLNPIQGGQSEEPRSEEFISEPTQPYQPTSPEPAPQPISEPLANSAVQQNPPIDDFVATPPPTPEPEPQPIVQPLINRPPKSGSGVLAVMGIIGILAATAIAIVSVVSSNNSSFIISSGQMEGLTVTATGTIDAIPDVAKLTFGITHKATTVDAVETKINETIDKIGDALDKFDIKDKDIKTSTYRIYPEYDYRSTTRRITGYTGTHQQTLTIRNLDDVNAIIDAVTDAGANTVGNVNFTIDDEEEWNSKARAEAIKNAKAKAKLIADEANIKLGKILSIDQGLEYPSIYRGVATDTGYGGGEDEIILPDIEPGSQELTATVTLTYEIK